MRNLNLSLCLLTPTYMSGSTTQPSLSHLERIHNQKTPQSKHCFS